MSTAARFRQADLSRALKAAKSAGFSEVKVRVDPAGAIEVIVGKAANEDRGPVELF
jgi:ribosomal protein L1